MFGLIKDAVATFGGYAGADIDGTIRIAGQRAGRIHFAVLCTVFDIEHKGRTVTLFGGRIDDAITAVRRGFGLARAGVDFARRRAGKSAGGAGNPNVTDGRLGIKHRRLAI